MLTQHPAERHSLKSEMSGAHLLEYALCQLFTHVAALAQPPSSAAIPPDTRRPDNQLQLVFERGVVDPVLVCSHQLEWISQPHFLQ